MVEISRHLGLLNIVGFDGRAVLRSLIRIMDKGRKVAHAVVFELLRYIYYSMASYEFSNELHSLFIQAMNMRLIPWFTS